MSAKASPSLCSRSVQPYFCVAKAAPPRRRGASQPLFRKAPLCSLSMQPHQSAAAPCESSLTPVLRRQLCLYVAKAAPPRRREGRPDSCSAKANLPLCREGSVTSVPEKHSHPYEGAPCNYLYPNASGPHASQKAAPQAFVTRLVDRLWLPACE